MKREPGRYVVKNGGKVQIVEVVGYCGEPWWRFLGEADLRSPGRMPTIAHTVDDGEVLSEPVEPCCCSGPFTVTITEAEEPKPLCPHISKNGTKPAAGHTRFAAAWADGKYCFIDAVDAAEADGIATEWRAGGDQPHRRPLWIASVPEVVEEDER